MVRHDESFVGELLIKRDHRGDLLMGHTSENRLHFYNVETGKTESLILDIEQKPASAKYIASFKEHYLRQLEDSGLKKHRIFKAVMAKLQNSSFREFFDDHLPYYSDIIISTEGDIVLVFDSVNVAVGSQVKGIIVSRDRKTQTGANLRIAPYRWPKNKNFKNISILGKSAYCLVMDPEEPDLYRLKKFSLNKVKTDK